MMTDNVSYHPALIRQDIQGLLSSGHACFPDMHFVRGADGNVIMEYNSQEWQRCFKSFAGVTFNGSSEIIYYGGDDLSLAITTDILSGLRVEHYFGRNGFSHSIQFSPDGLTTERRMHKNVLHHHDGPALRIGLNGKILAEEFYHKGVRFTPPAQPIMKPLKPMLSLIHSQN